MIQLATLLMPPADGARGLPPPSPLDGSSDFALALAQVGAVTSVPPAPPERPMLADPALTTGKILPGVTDCMVAPTVEVAVDAGENPAPPLSTPIVTDDAPIVIAAPVAPTPVTTPMPVVAAKPVRADAPVPIALVPAPNGEAPLETTESVEGEASLRRPAKARRAETPKTAETVVPAIIAAVTPPVADRPLAAETPGDPPRGEMAPTLAWVPPVGTGPSVTQPQPVAPRAAPTIASVAPTPIAMPNASSASIETAPPAPVAAGAIQPPPLPDAAPVSNVPRRTPIAPVTEAASAPVVAPARAVDPAPLTTASIVTPASAPAVAPLVAAPVPAPAAAVAAASMQPAKPSARIARDVEAPASIRTAAPRTPAITSRPTRAADVFAGALFAAAGRLSEREDDPLAAITQLFPHGDLAAPMERTLAATTPRLDTARPEWIAGMIDRIETLRDGFAGGTDQTRIRLSPDALGGVDVKIHRDEHGQVQVQISADTTAARAILADAAPRLVEMAEARGLKLGQALFADGGAASQGRQERQPAQPQTPSAPARTRRAADTPTDTDTRIA